MYIVYDKIYVRVRVWSVLFESSFNLISQYRKKSPECHHLRFMFLFALSTYIRIVLAAAISRQVNIFHAHVGDGIERSDGTRFFASSKLGHAIFRKPFTIHVVSLITIVRFPSTTKMRFSRKQSINSNQIRACLNYLYEMFVKTILIYLPML